MDAKASKPKPPTELQLFNPGCMTITPGKTMFPLEYVYAPDGGTSYKHPVDPITGKSAVLHIKTFNPVDPWYGLAPMPMGVLFAFRPDVAGDVIQGFHNWLDAIPPALLDLFKVGYVGYAITRSFDKHTEAKFK